MYNLVHLALFYFDALYLNNFYEFLVVTQIISTQLLASG